MSAEWYAVILATLGTVFAVLALIPFVNLLGLWVFAFADWPGRKYEN